MTVIPFPKCQAPKPAAAAPNVDAIEMIEGVLERLWDGKSVAIGVVEVRENGSVSTGFSEGDEYHALLSGATRLMHRIASIND